MRWQILDTWGAVKNLLRYFSSNVFLSQGFLNTLKRFQNNAISNFLQRIFSLYIIQVFKRCICLNLSLLFLALPPVSVCLSLLINVFFCFLPASTSALTEVEHTPVCLRKAGASWELSPHHWGYKNLTPPSSLEIHEHQLSNLGKSKGLLHSPSLQ